MLDPKLLRNHYDVVASALNKRGYILNVKELERLESLRKGLQIKTEELQNERNTRSKAIAQAVASDQPTAALKQAVAALKQELDQVKEQLIDVQQQWDDLAMGIPNIPLQEVPDGNSDADNSEISRVGQPPVFDFAAKDHVDLGESLQLLDFKSGIKLAEARFTVLKGELALLHRALIQMMLNTHTLEHGYTELNVPYLVNAESLKGTGQLPKFEEDQYKTLDERALYLIPTAEVPVTNLVRDQILSTLPLKYVCHSPCFRREAGSYGRDTRGMIRQHQFEKVELVQMVHPDDSASALEALTGHAETILQKLQLAYRKVVLCGGDLGFSACKTYDLEVYMPGQKCYREISSCSNFGDFQARRLKARFQNKGGKPQLIHTLNGSGLAVGRTLIAVMENYQQADGSIRVPEVLQPYMAGLEVIRA